MIRASLLVVLCGTMSTVLAAGNLDELLQQTRTSQASQASAGAERAAKYRAASPAQQAQMLKDALLLRNAAASANKAALERYNANELNLDEHNKQLKSQLTALGMSEVFGLARQVAGDSATLMQQSLTTAELTAAGDDDRVVALRRMSAADGVPSTVDLKRLWSELLREMTMSGQVAKFRAKVGQPNGGQQALDVIRVGVFTASAGHDYLGYLAELRSFVRLARQPPAAFGALAGDLAAASGGYVHAAVDPARGALLALYVERLSWTERIHRGGEVTYVIIAVGLLGLGLWAIQFLYLLVVRIAVALQLRDLDRLNRRNPLGRVLLAFKGDAARIEQDAEIAELRIAEAVLREVPSLERFQAFLRLAVAAGPLLGLIGTVIGMIITFQAITESGSSDPRLMANGIGQAMIATVAGLGIAIPLLFGNAMLSTLSRAVVQILDEQSTGLLAVMLERKRNA